MQLSVFIQIAFIFSFQFIMFGSMMCKVIENKKLIRSQMKQILAQMNEQEFARQSAIIQQKVLNHEMFKSAQKISIYLSLKNEVDTSNLIKEIFLRGKKCYIPKYKVGKERKMEMVLLNSLEDLETLPLTNWNIRQPADEDNSRENCLNTGGLDLMIIPGFAFSKEGHRLGKGGGFYDTYMEKMRNSSNVKYPYLMGLAIDQQVLENVPYTDHDIKVDAVISPN